MNILITGASKGIGFDTVLKLAQSANNQILALSRDEDGLQNLLTTASSGNVNYLVYDVMQPNATTLLQKIKSLGTIDVFVNNAGLLINKPFEQLTSSDWQRTFATNLFGVVEMVRLLIPFLEKSKQAHIVNIGSMGGFQGSSKFPGLAAYSASKAALANLTECLAEELKEKKIAVNCLAFGAVQTKMLEAAFPGYQAPLGSVEMADWVAWFCMNGHRFFNGKILPVSVSTP